MDNFGGIGFGDVSKSAKRKRSIRPRQSPESYQHNFDNPENASVYLTTMSNSISRRSGEENYGHGTGDQSNLVTSSTGFPEDETVNKIVNAGSNISKFKKVKLKVGGVTRTIDTKTSAASSLDVSSSVKCSDSSGSLSTHQDGPSDVWSRSSRDQGSGMRGIPWKDFSKSGFSVKILNSSLPKVPKLKVKQTGTDQSARKSKRAPKKRLLGDVFDDEKDDDDDEIRFLEKLRTSKLSSYCGAAYEDEDVNGTSEQENISMLSHEDIYGHESYLGYDDSRSRHHNMPTSERASEDNDYFMEEDSLSDDDTELQKKKQHKETRFGNFKGEKIVSTRQQALKRSRAISHIEFPNGLPPAPSKKQKEKISDVEQQLKKAEAAQRRRMQTEKAAREAEAEAIRKILGQDSTRKKQEDKLKKRQEEMAQKRAANSILSSNSIRWTIGPSGTTVTFPDEMGLPSIFESKQCSYPPPREKCAGPFCTNAYKYRDSKSKLPLCSLQCYRALNEKIQTAIAS